MRDWRILRVDSIRSLGIFKPERLGLRGKLRVYLFDKGFSTFSDFSLVTQSAYQSISK